MRIGIIGAGQVGQTLGRGWAAAGHDVVYGVRETGAPAPHAGSRVGTVKAAASHGEVVALVTPWTAVPDALRAAGDFGGKPLIDVTNPIGPGFALAVGHTTSGAEEVARLATGARVVKAFHSTGLETMAEPVFGDRRAMMPVAGDDPSAVEAAKQLATDLGFESIGLGGLVHARALEPFALLWIKLALAWGQGRNIAFGLTRRAAEEKIPATKRAGERRRITIVGSGNIGGALARAWLRAGHEVRIATRDASSGAVAGLVSAGAVAIPLEGAASEVNVFAIPAGAVVDVAGSMGALEDKIVVDCTNAIAKGFTLRYGLSTSSSEEIAKALPRSKVVRSFNQQGAETLENPSFGGLAATNFVAADDDEARRVVRDLASDVGLDAIEAGPLSSSRYLEPFTLLWVAISQSIGTRQFGVSLLRR